eukprot:2025494-Amphidinium_carterae.1
MVHVCALFCVLDVWAPLPASWRMDARTGEFQAYNRLSNAIQGLVGPRNNTSTTSYPYRNYCIHIESHDELNGTTEMECTGMCKEGPNYSCTQEPEVQRWSQGDIRARLVDVVETPTNLADNAST